MKDKSFKAIDFFCGAGGMTSGFRKAGVEVLAGIDIDHQCKETYEFNHPNSKFIEADIKKLKYSELEKFVSIRKMDDQMIFIGCSPCQYFSTIKTNKSKSIESKNLLNDFQRFVKHYLPGFVVIENVPGIVTSPESPLKDFVNFLKKKNYKVSMDILRLEKFGIPQTRRRFLLVASRVDYNISLPTENVNTINTVREFIHPKKGFPILKAGYRDESPNLHTVAGLSEVNLKRLSKTIKNGGDRMSYVNDVKLAVPCQYKKPKTFHDTYGRMRWDSPAPTITTKFFSISNGRFAHPTQNRALSLREGARLQTFDLSYRFIGSSIGCIARQIGNAVPPLFAMQIAKQIMNKD
ncbi:DNA cytosine methyltransferase [Leptospira limi]|uniref:DNA (cytosine-5-)-methyltransferase n=1 Tax=Leptospira limi TaxID=2950023 RepID=A0ABT3M2A3_9LEPT|nr:DNA cytosine methyltransferase [Leptospira limi]MCW7463712.1 DNA cytosine methyltransferase [Leptospira limi]